MPENRESYVTVVGVDFSDASKHALDEALVVTSARGGDVHALHVDDDVFAEALLNRGLNAALDEDAALTRLKTMLTEQRVALGKRLRTPGLRRAVGHVRRGRPAEQLAQLAADLDADLVVVGSQGRRGWERLVLGSVAERTSKVCRCPVWIVRPKDHNGEANVPKVDPPCPECVAKRLETNGRVFWCARHSEPHIRPHVLAYVCDPLYSTDSSGYEATPR